MSARKIRVSGSFSSASVEVGAAVLLGLMRGQDVRVMVARPAFAVFARTVASLAAIAVGQPLKRVTRSEQALEALRKYDHPVSRVHLQKALGWERGRTLNALRELHERGLAECVGASLHAKWQAVQPPSNVVQISDRKAASV